MRRFVLYLGLFAATLLSSSFTARINVPSNSRSNEAIGRVRPGIEKELAGKGLRLGCPIFIRIFKESKELELWTGCGKKYELFRKYAVCTYGNGSLGPKIKQGDGQAPEGFYTVTPRQMNPSSDFHLSFNLAYPNEYDRAYKRTGSDLMVHGNCVSIGCYAMTDEGIEEIYTLADAALRNGQKSFKVHIFPFRMSDESMKKHQDSEWYGFWQNLKQGYDLFERNEKSGTQYRFLESRVRRLAESSRDAPEIDPREPYCEGGQNDCI